MTNNYSYVNLPFPYSVLAYHLDYDRRDGVIYWVHLENQIYSGSIFGTNISSVRYMNGIARVYGIAVDSISRLLFYTDYGNLIIAAISLQDFSQKTVISSGLVAPRDIAIDPIHGTIYWIDIGVPAKIKTSNYDGTNIQEVVNTGLTTPYGLDLDIIEGVLYWCEARTFKIERANVDGSNRFLIYQDQVSESECSISLYHSYIYFIRKYSRTDIMRIRTDGSGLISVAPTSSMYPLGIHVDFNLNIDNVPENFLLAIDRAKRSISRMDLDNFTYINIQIQNGSNPYAIEYDPKAAVMFWTDVDFRQIISGSIYGNNKKTLRSFKYCEFFYYRYQVDTGDYLYFCD
ncbi:hypothetical protein ACJMK2_022976 [Sinanodonta woodiana]|uniref:Prolow-density lipoprotein receptor-related protein 1-like beta-propeller domain-containing protein n=1 Tax=Sinanodonta woodiana TaxID=1069815 RepID=A0ABD3TLM9_SINWO